jgi:RNA-directed DNA polymerase
MNAPRRKRGRLATAPDDFLGFTHICGITRSNGWFQLQRVTMAKRMHGKLAEIKLLLRRRLQGPAARGRRWGCTRYCRVL